MRFRVGEPINSRVGKKLKSLQKVFAAKSGEDRQKYIELQQAVPWIRMQSGVKITDPETAKMYNTTEGYALAKEYTLFGANARISTDQYTPDTSDIRNLPGYQKSADFDIRPKPGITGMSIRSHNRFGSLRTASVRFVCWTKEQIDALELLFMRPGYSVLLEWGHSKNLTTDGDSVENLDLGVDLYGISDTADAVYEAIITKRLTNHYGYDAILGQVKNFTWSLRADGGYDCTTDLVSPGDLIESFKANFFLPQGEIQAALEREIERTDITLKFPSVFRDSVDVPYELDQVPQVQALYRAFVVQAKAGLIKAKQSFRKLVEDAAAELAGGNNAPVQDLWLKVVSDSGQTLVADSYQEKAEDLKLIADLVDMLEIAQGGTQYGTILVQRSVGQRYVDSDGIPSRSAGFVTWYANVAATPRSDWNEGIVDLNVGSNIENGVPKADLPDGGYVALMPRSINEFLDKKVFGLDGMFSKLNTYRSGASAAFDKAKSYLVFLENALATDPDWTDFGRTARAAKNVPTGIGSVWVHGWEGYAEDSSANNSNPSGIAGTNRREDAPIWTTLTRDPALKYQYIEVPTSIQNSDGTYKWYNKNAGQEEYWNPTKHSGNPNDKVGGTSLVGPLLFLPMKFTGFDPANRDAGVLNVGEEDTLVKAQVVDSYVSKLHFYLRNYIELPYAANHLSAPVPNESFSSIFGYRSIDTTEIEKALAGGDKVALPHRNKNIPAKVTQDISSLLGGSFFNEDVTVYQDTVYVKLGTLLELINKHILRSDSEYFFTFVSGYEAGYEPLYFTWSDHISMDPRVCILPHTVTSTNLSIPGYTGDGKARILDIELSINFVLETLNQYISNEGKVSIYDFIQSLLDNINRVCGGVNDLQLQFVEDSYKEGIDEATGKTVVKEIYRSKFHIVDRKVLAPITKKSFEQIGAKFNLFGLDSIIHDVRLESRLTPKISSMIAISAQANPYTSTEEATGFNAINKGLVDRIFTKRYDMEQKANEDAFEEQNFDKAREALKEQITGILQSLAYFYEKAATPPAADEQIGTYENYAKFLLGLSNKFTPGAASYNFIIPFELNLTLHGMSGIKVMDAFTVSEDILPKTYGGRKDSPVAFLVTGVEQGVDRNGWKTSLRTQIYNIDENEAYVDPYKDYNLKLDIEKSALNVLLDTRAAGNSAPGNGRKNPSTNPGKTSSAGKCNADKKEDMPAIMADATPGLCAKWVPVGKGYGATITWAPVQDRWGKPHLGIDVACDEGTPIYSTTDGTLHRLMYGKGTVGTGDENGGYGIYAVYVVDGSGKHHLYGHLSGNPDTVTDIIGESRIEATGKSLTVKKGQLIGFVGSRGQSTGPHLHYEILNNVNNKYKGTKTLVCYDVIKHLNSLESEIGTTFVNAQNF